MTKRATAKDDYSLPVARTIVVVVFLKFANSDARPGGGISAIQALSFFPNPLSGHGTAP
jgi:hypothetical protein